MNLSTGSTTAVSDPKAPNANISTSVLIDQASEEAKGDQEVAQEEQTETSDLAKMLGTKVCRKTGLKQLFFSLNIDMGTTQEFSKNFRLMAATEQKISALVNSLDCSNQNQ